MVELVAIYEGDQQLCLPDKFYHVSWHLDVVVISTAQLHSTKHELRFCVGSNPACGVSEICNGEDL